MQIYDGDKSELRPMTPDEIADYEAIAAQYEAKVEAEKAKEAARQALLDKLGITADEAKLLLG